MVTPLVRLELAGPVGIEAGAVGVERGPRGPAGVTGLEVAPVLCNGSAVEGLRGSLESASAAAATADLTPIAVDAILRVRW